VPARPLRHAAAALRSSRTLPRAIRSPTNGLTARWASCFARQPAPTADYSPSLRSPWLAAGELVNNAAHELAHAGQQQWIETWWRTPDALPQTLRARISDYQKNEDYKNTAWESHALIGVMGSADYDRYRHQPLEEDAWAIGSYAETRALALISETAEAPPIQAKVQEVSTAAAPAVHTASTAAAVPAAAKATAPTNSAPLQSAP